MRKMLLLVLFASVFIIISSCTQISQEPKTKDIKYCKVTLDCAPATCCHPEDVLNKKYAPDCTDAICTQVCQGPLDCNAGKIECIQNKCVIIKTTQN